MARGELIKEYCPDSGAELNWNCAAKLLLQMSDPQWRIREHATRSFQQLLESTGASCFRFEGESSLTDQEDERLAHELAEKSNKQYSVTIDCLAWMECFDETRGKDRAAMAHRIRNAVYREERRLAEHRKFAVIGAGALRRWRRKSKVLPEVAPFRSSSLRKTRFCNRSP